jgi:integrase/recombinase XerD
MIRYWEREGRSRVSEELSDSERGLIVGGVQIPRLVAAAGDRASRRFIEFFTANIRNPNTRDAYARAVGQFLSWCEMRGLQMETIEAVAIAAYIEQHSRSKPTVKQHLAAIKMLFDWMVVGQIMPYSPAASVRGPKYVVKKGKTPVLSSEQARELLDSIDISNVVGLRDRALIAVMVYSFARIGAVVGMNVEDYWQNGKRWWLRFLEKGGKHHEVPAHHNAEEYLDSYLKASRIADEPSTPLFRTAIRRTRMLTSHRLTRNDALRMIKRHARMTGLPRGTCCHTFRATGITAYLENGGTIENAQTIAAHESPRTTKLYDRTSDEITLDEIERIVI